MPLRIAFDMDGVLADFEAAFLDVERRLFGEDVPPPPELPENLEIRIASSIENALDILEQATRAPRRADHARTARPASSAGGSENIGSDGLTRSQGNTRKEPLTAEAAEK